MRQQPLMFPSPAHPAAACVTPRQQLRPTPSTPPASPQQSHSSSPLIAVAAAALGRPRAGLPPLQSPVRVQQRRFCNACRRGGAGGGHLRQHRSGLPGGPSGGGPQGSAPAGARLLPGAPAGLSLGFAPLQTLQRGASLRFAVASGPGCVWLLLLCRAIIFLGPRSAHCCG